jgi:hypothetical protein
MIDLKTPIYSVKTIFVVLFSLLTIIILIQLIIPSVTGERPSIFFDEGSIITWLSSLQLGLMGFLAYKIHLLKQGQNPAKSSLFWRLLSFGFIFLALDDLLMIHEHIDHWIQSLLQLDNSSLLTRIDDLIVGLYGGIILWLISQFRKELVPYRSVLPLLLWALFLGAIMFSIDLINHHENDLAILISDAATRKIVYKYLGPVEEIFKIWTEGFLVIALYSCWQIQYQTARIFRKI